MDPIATSGDAPDGWSSNATPGDVCRQNQFSKSEMTDRLKDLLKTWVAPLLTAAVLAYFTTWFADHAKTAKLFDKQAEIDITIQALGNKTSSIKEDMARYPAPDQLARKEDLVVRYDAIQRELQSISNQLSEIRQAQLRK